MLCNKLGIHDAANLTKAQYRVTSEKITQATTLRVVLGAQGYRQLSAHILQYLYDWTGETGSVHTFRPGTFFARAIHPTRSRTALQDFCRQGPGRRHRPGDIRGQSGRTTCRVELHPIFSANVVVATKPIRLVTMASAESNVNGSN